MGRLAEKQIGVLWEARAEGMDLAADYLLMDSWLAVMTSRLLLPKPEAVGDEEPTGEEMAGRLSFRLKRLEAMRQAVRELEAGPVLNNVVFLRGAPVQPKVVKLTEFTATLYDLTSAFGFIRDRKEKEAPHRIEKQPVMALEQARNTLRGLRKQLDNWSSLDDIRTALSETTPDVPGRSVTASVFSAALELTRDGEVELRQDAHFSPLYLRNTVRTGEGLDATA